MSTTPTGTRPSAERPTGATVLTGTPVVPGVALGPVVRPIGAVELPGRPRGREVPEDRARRREGPVLRRGRRRGGAAGGAGGGGHRGERRGADHDRAGSPVTAACCRPSSSASGTGASAEVATVAGRASSSWTCSPPGRGDGRAGHRRPGRPRPDRRRADRAGRARRPEPRTCPSVLLADDLAPADTAGLDPARVDRPGHPAGRHDQPHRDHRPPARAALRRRASAGWTTCPRGRPSCSTASRARSPSTPTRPRRRCGWPRRGGRRRAGRLRAARAPPATGTPVQVLANVQDGAGARAAAAAHAEGVGLFRTELAFLGRTEEPVGRGAGGRATRRCFDGLRRAQGRAAHAGRRLGQAAGLRHRCRTRRTRRSGSAGCASPGATPGCSTRQLDAVAEAAAADRVARRG